MRSLILLLVGFTFGHFATEYYFKKAWKVENLSQASAMQAKMSNIKGCVDALNSINKQEQYYPECEVKARDTYRDVYEIMTKNPDHIFTTRKAP